MAPLNGGGLLASARSGMASSASRTARTRSTLTAACAMVFVIAARALTGLKKFRRYDRNTVSAPTVIAPWRMSHELRHKTNAVHSEIVTVTIGPTSAFTLRALSAALTVAWLT